MIKCGGSYASYARPVIYDTRLQPSSEVLLPFILYLEPRHRPAVMCNLAR